MALTTTLKSGDAVFIGDNIRITYNKKSGNCGTLHIDAPGIKIIKESSIIFKSTVCECCRNVITKKEILIKKLFPFMVYSCKYCGHENQLESENQAENNNQE